MPKKKTFKKKIKRFHTLTIISGKPKIGRGTYIDLDPPRYGWPHHQRRRANRNIILNLSHHHEDKKKSWKILHLDSKGR